jgi:hypothetical protein
VIAYANYMLGQVIGSFLLASIVQVIIFCCYVGSNPLVQISGSLPCYQDNDYHHWHMTNMKVACQEPSSKDHTSTTQSKDLTEFTYKGHHIARLQKISSLL